MEKKRFDSFLGVMELELAQMDARAVSFSQKHPQAAPFDSFDNDSKKLVRQPP